MADSSCCICYEELAGGLTAAPCGHVMHTTCIDQWHKTSPTCPICKVGLPRRRSQLLKLFFSAGNPSPRADEDHRLSCSTTAAASGGAEVETGDGGEADSREGQHLSPADARALRSELACARRIVEEKTLVCARNSEHVKALTERLVETKATCAVRTMELEGMLESTAAELERMKIDLSKKHKECFRATREMEALKKQVVHYRSEERTQQYISQVSAGKSRGLNGLGQVSVEPIIEDVVNGRIRPEDIIRSQHETLSRNMAQQASTLQSLRKCKREQEEKDLEWKARLKEARLLCRGSADEVHRLKAALAKATSESKKRRDTCSSPSGRSLHRTEDANSKKRARVSRDKSDVGIRRQTVRPPAAGYISLEDDDDDEEEEEEEEKEEDLVSSSSDKGPRSALLGGLAGRWDSPNAVRPVGRGRDAGMERVGKSSKEEGACTMPSVPKAAQAVAVETRDGLEGSSTRLQRALGFKTVPAGAPQSFRSASVPSSSRGKYVRTGYNAVGGTHSVATASIRGLPDALQRNRGLQAAPKSSR